jgi:hypothetical protein
MRCEDFIDALPDFINRHLPHEDSYVMLDHLTACGDCRHALALELALRRLTERFVTDTLPAHPFALLPSVRPMKPDPYAAIIRRGGLLMPLEFIRAAIRPLTDTIELVQKIV